MAQARAGATLAAMGVECLNLFITAAKPAPQMAKALQAECREGLQQRADQAVYALRTTAPRVLLALAFKLMGENAQRIETLTITPELLGGLPQGKD